MSELLSMRAYASRRGVSAEAVSKKVRKGQLSTVIDPTDGKRKIDPEVADREWVQNTSPAHPRGNHLPAPPPTQVGEGMSYHDARRMKEEYLAKNAQLEFEERSGKLVDAEKVKQEWSAVASTVRTKVLGIPAKARQRMPEITLDGYEVLEAIVREALEDLSSDGA